MITPENFSENFNNENFKEIYNQTFEQFKANISEEKFVELSTIFHREANDLSMKYNNTLKVNFHRYSYMNDKETHFLIVAFTDKNDIVGIEFHLNHKYDTDNIWTKNEYYVPLEEAVVSAGGIGIFHNYHYQSDNQRYAYDFTNMIELYQHNGAPADLEAYFAYGSDVLAPLDGTVVEVKKDLLDNSIGTVNSEDPSGNYIIIEHDNHEYSLLAHLKRNSVKVKPGDKVKAKEVIAQVGNSGATTLPHLHFQIMSGKELNKDSIRVRFKNHETLTQGDRIEEL